MKTNKLLQMFLVLILSSWVVTSCASPVVAATPKVPEPSKTPTFVLTEPTATFLIPTAVPTLLFEQQKRLAKALQSTECVLPCYLGIIPGKTPLQDARAILESLGGRYWGPFQRTKTDGAFSYHYQFHIGDTASGETIIYADVTLISDNNLVQIIDAGSGTGRFSLVDQKTAIETYRQYWQRYYSVRQIFLQLGEPDQLYPDGSDALIVFYKDPEIRIDIVGLAQENNLCPKDRLVNYLSVDMIISNPHSPFGIDGDGGVPLTDREVYLPIEETFGVSVRDFYRKVLADSTVCFEPKK